MKRLLQSLVVCSAVILAMSAMTVHGTPNPNWVRAVEWSPAGDRIAYSIEAGSVAVLDSQTGELIASLKEADGQPVYSLAWSPDATRLAGGTTRGRTAIWDVASGQMIRELQWKEDFVDGIRSLTWNPDSAQLATASQGGYPENVHVWHVDTGQSLFLPVVGDVLSVAWSPDGATLAIGKHGEFQLWDVVTQQHVSSIKAPGGHVVDLAWSPDGRRLAS